MRYVLILALLLIATISQAAEPQIIIEYPKPDIDLKIIAGMIEVIRNETGLSNYSPPPIVVDWKVPLPYLGGLQFPTEDNPTNRLQISVPPRVIDINEKMTKGFLYYVIGHEMLHDAFMQMGYAAENKFSHHCERNYREILEKVVDHILTVFRTSYDLKNRTIRRLPIQCVREGGKIN